MNYSNKSFNTTLNDLFNVNNVGVREFARKSGVNYSYLSKLRNGKMPPPSDDVIKKIAKAFSIPADYFLEYRLRHIYQSLLTDPDMIAALHYMSKQPATSQKRIRERFIKFVKQEVSNN